jgi:hypothetical protein
VSPYLLDSKTTRRIRVQAFAHQVAAPWRYDNRFMRLAHHRMHCVFSGRKRTLSSNQKGQQDPECPNLCGRGSVWQVFQYLYRGASERPSGHLVSSDLDQERLLTWRSKSHRPKETSVCRRWFTHISNHRAPKIDELDLSAVISPRYTVHTSHTP